MSHSKTVAELESRMLDQEIKHKAEIAERGAEISQTQQSAEERLRELQKLASDEQETLRVKIRFVCDDFCTQMLLRNGSCHTIHLS